MKRKIRVVVSAVMFLTFFWMPSRSYGQGNAEAQVQIEKLRIEAGERERKEREQRDWEMRIFEVKYASLNDLQRALSLFSVVTHISENPRVITVRAPKEIMPAVEDVIKRFDAPSAPSKDAELTIYVLSAGDGPPAVTVPPVLQPVVNQLKTLLSYKTFTLIDTQFVRGKSGTRASTKGGLPSFGNFPSGSPYSFSANFGVVTADQKMPVLQLRDMNFHVAVSNTRLPIAINSQIEISSQQVDISNGQQVVIGKATVGESALILVMTAKIID